MENYINVLVQQGWLFQTNKSLFEKKDILDFANGKLKNISSDFFDFLNSYKVLSNKEDTVWSIPLEEYSTDFEKNDDEFSWNDYEVESLEYADNKEEIKKIVDFWDKHLPFLFSVKNGYAYIALVVKGDNKDKIVYGREPEYEDIRVVANSFGEFQKIHSEFLTAKKKDDVLSDFI